MKKSFVFQLIAVTIFTIGLTAMPAQTHAKSMLNHVVSVSPDTPDNITVTVTIVKIDLPTNSISLKDGDGKIWNFVVDPQLINLRNFKVGQQATATV